MNDVVASALQKARAEFARSTTTQARQTMMRVRQFDRVREIDSRFYVMFEAACLLRENSSAAATNALRGIAPLSEAEWAELLKILGSAAENKFPAFTSACRGLRIQVTPPTIVNISAKEGPTTESHSQPKSSNASSPRRLIAKDELKEVIANELVDDKGSIEDRKSSPEGRRQIAKAYAKHVLYGLAGICVGVGATWWSYKSATPGNYYWGFWGVIAYGVGEFFYGLFGWIFYTD